MKRIEIDSELNPFFDATERFLVKFQSYKEKTDFADQHKNLVSSSDLYSLKTNTEYFVEIDHYTEYPYITITEKKEIIERFRTGLEFFENSIL